MTAGAETCLADAIGQFHKYRELAAGGGWKSLSIPKGKSKEFDVARSGKPYRVA